MSPLLCAVQAVLRSMLDSWVSSFHESPVFSAGRPQQEHSQQGLLSGQSSKVTTLWMARMALTGTCLSSGD